MGSASEMHEAGADRKRIVLGRVAVATALTAPLGYLVADALGREFTSVANGFAAGVLLVMLATSVAPEAREKLGCRGCGHGPRVRPWRSPCRRRPERSVHPDTGPMNVLTDYADAHWIPIDGSTVTVQTVDAEGNRQTHMFSVAEAIAQFQVTYPFIADEAVTELFTRTG